MKKFFKSKEAGTITPLPPTGPAAATSTSFATPRPFDEYQARVASQTAAESNRPLSLQAPPRSSRAARDSFDEAGSAHTYSPPLRQQPRSQQPANTSPRKNRFSNHIHPAQAADAPYESFSDPTSAHSQPLHPLRPPYDRSNTTDHDARRSQQQLPLQPHAGTMSSMAALSPPKSLRPAPPPAGHRRDGSLSISVASGPAYQSQNQSQNGSVDHHYSRLPLPPTQLPPSSVNAAWAAPRHRRSDDSADSGDPRYNDDDDDGRTPTATDAPRSAAYPVYSGADGDEDSGEVLISQGRYEETTLRDLGSKDKGKGKKLFGFATGSNKDKKAKQDRERAAASSPIPRASRDRNDAALMSPPVDSRSHSAQERHKEGGWMDRWSKRTHQHQAARMQDRELEDVVASRIGWLSANALDEHDWMQILPLIDMVSQSEPASKEAARALRKEFKYGTVDTQRRAVRIWALLTLNASDRFRLQIANRRFLEAIEDTVASSKTPLSVKETMLRVLGVLAFEFKGDAELTSITKCWNKVKPSDRPKDGEPLEDDLFEFRLPQPRGLAQLQQFQQPRGQQPSWRRTTQRYSQQPEHEAFYEEVPSHRQHQQHQQQVLSADPTAQLHHHSATFAPPTTQLAQVPMLIQPQVRPPPPGQQQQEMWPRPALPPPDLDPQTRSYASLIPPPIDHSSGGSATDVISNLEAAAASMDSHSASFRSSSADSSFTPLHDVVAFDEDVRRLHEECHIARSNAAVLLDTLLHEGLYADTAELVDEFYVKVGRSQELIASQIAWASAQADQSRMTAGAGERETREERLLADLLEAHGRTSEVLHMVEDARRRIEEEEAERRVTERSMVEVRLDRSALVQDGVSGELWDGGGRATLNAQASGSRSPSPNTALSVPSPTNGTRIARPLPVPRSDKSSDSNSTHSYPQPSSKTRSPLPQTPLNVDIARQHDDDEVQTPVVPSEKALGKRRAVSVRYPTPPVEAGAKPKLPPLPPRVAEGVEGVAGMRLE